MRYNQPYGTAEPPLGTYPRYINGNPTTGTEGSIPPARALDEDQIEIINVIANTGLTPNHTELDQLWQALMILLAQKYITTAVTKTVHGAGADFPDLNAALAWASEYIITATGSLTLMVAAGRWTYTQTVEINHANSSRITIQGAALLGATPQPNNLSVTGYMSASDGTNQIIYLRSVYATELSFTGGINGFRSLHPGAATLRYLLITGSQTTAQGNDGLANYGTDQGNGIRMEADINLDGVSIWGFGSTGIRVDSHHLRFISSLSIVVSYCIVGISVLNGTVAAPLNNVCILTSNYIGVQTWGGWLWFHALNVRGSAGQPGVGCCSIQAGGFLRCALNSGSVFSQNTDGPWITGGAVWEAQGSNTVYQNNVRSGFTVHGPGHAMLSNVVVSGNGTTALRGFGSAYIEARGASITGTCQPVANTEGTEEDAYTTI